MEFIESIIIDKPREHVAKIYELIRYSKEYNSTLVRVNSIEGKIGGNNSITELIYDTNGTEFIHKETVLTKNFPFEFTFEIQNELSITKTTVLFIEVNENSTELKMKTEYAKTGILLSFGMKAQKKFIRNQLIDSLRRVKSIVESS